MMNETPSTDTDNKPQFYEKKWFKIAGRIIKPILNLKPINKYLSKTKSGLMGRIPRIYKEGNFLEALRLSVEGLSKCKKNNQYIDNYYWWCFLSYSVYCARMLNNNVIMKKLYNISKYEFEPLADSYASYCFCQFSRYMYLEGKYEKAVELAIRAKDTDNSAGLPFYLLGYYDLLVSEIDPLENFKKAVENDPSILKRIADHPKLQGHPEIYIEVKKHHIKGLKAGSNI
jgi:tetratricopeptide (TPR) repeat protein